MRRLALVYGRHFLLIDLAALSVAAVWIRLHFGSFDPAGIFNGTLGTNRATVYGTFASMLGTMLGFAITAVSILIAVWSHASLKLVRESPHSPTLWRTFTSCIRWLALATAVCLIALLLDTPPSPVAAVSFFAAWATAVAVSRLVHTVRFFEKLIQIVTQPE
jgi:uncharacterized membrane protein YbhN (UPF0104 family)